MDIERPKIDPVVIPKIILFVFLQDISPIAVKAILINVGQSFVVLLTDGNGNPIPNQIINIKLTDKNNITMDEDLTTNAKGKAKFKMEEKGKYSFACSFDGNNQYDSSSTAGKITVKKAETKNNNDQSSNTKSSSGLCSDGSYYPEYGPAVDSKGVTREYAIAHNWHYILLTIDGVDSGLYVSYDPINRCYHT